MININSLWLIGFLLMFLSKIPFFSKSPNHSFVPVWSSIQLLSPFFPWNGKSVCWGIFCWNENSDLQFFSEIYLFLPFNNNISTFLPGFNLHYIWSSWSINFICPPRSLVLVIVPGDSLICFSTETSPLFGIFWSIYFWQQLMAVLHF